MPTNAPSRQWDYITIAGRRLRFSGAIVVRTLQYPREGRSVTSTSTLQGIQAEADADRSELETQLASIRTRITAAKALPASPNRGQIVDQLERLAGATKKASLEAGRTASFAAKMLGPASPPSDPAPTSPSTGGGGPTAPVVVAPVPSTDPGEW